MIVINRIWHHFNQLGRNREACANFTTGLFRKCENFFGTSQTELEQNPLAKRHFAERFLLVQNRGNSGQATGRDSKKMSMVCL